MSGELAEQDGITPLADDEGPDKPTGKLGRRALMLGAATGVGAAVAVVAGASPAGAANGDPVAQGEVNTCSATTEVSTSSGSGLLGTINEDQTGLLGSLAPGSQAAGVVGDVVGTSGVIGLSGDVNGVYGVRHGLSGITGQTAGVLGESDSNDGVIGLSSAGSGVYGISSGASGLSVPSAGVVGDSDNNDGVTGLSFNGNGVSGYATGTGVYGDAGNYGVFGTSMGTGVYGVAGQMEPYADPGIGVNGYGYGDYSIGVLAQAPDGTALQVDGTSTFSDTATFSGKAKFSSVATFTRSGVATLSAAATSVLVTVPGGLTSTSHVLATMQTNHSTLAVRAAVPDTANGKVNIYFTESAPVGAKVAWFVFG